MELPVTYVFTHDSIAVGEDGPTHEPVEQVMSLRLMPHMRLIRPADANETAVAWKLAVESKKHPTALALTRQAVPTFDRTKYAGAEGVRKGAYVFSDVPGTPDVILIGTGSELQLAVAAQEKLAGEGIKARVVSMPCWDLFDEQSAEYKESVLPSAVRARVAVEAGTPIGWERYVGLEGRIVGQKQFGASGPAKEVFKHFGFSAENVVEHAKETIAAVKGFREEIDESCRCGRPRRLAVADARVGGGTPAGTRGPGSGNARRVTPDDYPDRAADLAAALKEGRAERGILICGSGVGASVAANKVRGIRAALCHDTYSAHQGVEHDQMNVLCLGARVIGEALALELVRAFLGADFSGEPRHRRRVEKIAAMEARF